jgi:glycosyltransferase involved in cell wall biosynthesis
VTGPVVHVAKVAGISGAETHLLSLLPGLRARGWDVRFAMLHEGEPGARELARSLAAEGVPVEPIRLRADLDPRAFLRLVRSFARSRPAIVHTHLVHADLYGQPAARLARVPVRFSTKHGFNEFRERPGFALADRLVGGLVDVHVAVSRGLAHYLARTEGFDESGFEIAHYGVRLAPPAERYLGTPRILAVGRLIPIKGHAVLLRAFAAALPEAPDLELRIAGSGPLESTLHSLAAGLGIEARARFLGLVQDMRPEIEASSFVVVPSLGEGFGLVALEAMERSRAVIASGVGGLLDLVSDGETGLLVPPSDVDALARAIVALACDPDRARRMGEAGRRRAEQEFSVERSVDRIERLYVGALEPRRAST